MQKFRDIVENRHQLAREWKERTGGKAVGHLCCYMPEELIYAAGALPVRVIGSREHPALAENYVVPWACPFTRGVLHEAAKASYGIGALWSGAFQGSSSSSRSTRSTALS